MAEPSRETPLEAAYRRLAEYHAAESRIIKSGERRAHNGRAIQDPQLVAIQEGIARIKDEIARLEFTASGASRISTLVPR